MEPLTQRMGLWIYGTCASGIIVFTVVYMLVTVCPRIFLLK